jgi:hypothetical protein
VNAFSHYWIIVGLSVLLAFLANKFLGAGWHATDFVAFYALLKVCELLADR